MTTVTIGGEELTLLRPVGRAGRRFVAKVQGVLRTLTPIALSLSDTDQEDLTSTQLNALLEASSHLFENESLEFEDEVLPGVYMFSSAKLTKDKALAKLDKIEDTPLELTIMFITASTYWINPPTDEQEALSEAVKKSPSEKKAES